MRLTALAHTLLAPRLRPGDIAVDATAGNGHDTRFLAEAVGDTGLVLAFDIQPEALDATRRRLEKAGVAGRVRLILDSNAHLAARLPDGAAGRVAAVMANLGWLPGGDPALITQTGDTVRMLDDAFAALRPGGALSVLAYPGHAGGDAEAEAVEKWLRARAAAGHALTFHGDPGAPERRPWLGLLLRMDSNGRQE